MREWSGGWGFEPFVERLVENAIPPYLIGQERATMNPFVARQNDTPASADESNLTFGTSAPVSDEYQIDCDSNCWRRLEQGLSAYIVQQKQLGIIPTDKQLQDKGRMIIYNDEDPWNQTAADNPQWLECLRQQHGIATQPVAEPPKLEEVPMLPPYAVRGGLKERAKSCRSTHVAGGTFTSDLVTAPTEIAHAPIPAMDFEFDQLDFDNLDLGLMDDVEMEASDPLLAFDMEGQMLQDQLMPAFDSFDMQQNQTMDGNLMSEHDLHQLSGYMAGFQQ
jgi:hypothetical protein